MWGATDGAALESLDAHILGPTELLLMVDEKAWSPNLVDQGFQPVLDDHQSNYLAVFVRGPLACGIVHLRHDGENRLLYGDVDSFIGSLDQRKTIDVFLHDTNGDYPPDVPRTEADRIAARALMATDGVNEEWIYAAQLLDASSFAEWTVLLKTDHSVRRDVVARMEKMTGPVIRELLQRGS